MRKIIFTIFLLSAFSALKAQETNLIVTGHLKGGNSFNLSDTFNKNLFCFNSGDYVLPWLDHFDVFQVDSVISGSFQNSIGEQCATPFDIKLGRLNECTLLKFNTTITLTIKQFPNTSVYYTDSIEQVHSGEQYTESVAVFRKQHEQTLKILKYGTVQEKKEALDKTNSSSYGSTSDYRYIKYILPYMNSRDSIMDYYLIEWDGVDKNGNMIGGTDTIYEKSLFSDYLQGYISKIPFEVPLSAGETNWEEWYKSLFSGVKCFPEVKFAQSSQTIIAPCNGIAYFLPDVTKRKILFKSNVPYIFDVDNDELKMTRNEEDKYSELSFIRPFVVPVNDEIAFFDWHDKIIWGTARDGAFYKQGETIINELKYDDTHNTERTFPNIVIPSGDDFIIFWGEDINEHNFAKIGKVNRKGKWLMKAVSILDYKQPFYYNSSPEVGSLSYLHLSDSTFLISFSVNDYKQEDNSTIFLKKIDSNLNTLDSASLNFDFPTFDYSFNETWMVENNGIYLLLCKTHHNDGNELYYRILDDKLNPLTDFILLSKYVRLVASPVTIKDGFMISWSDDEITDGNLRSVLINSKCESSGIINIMSGDCNFMYNFAFSTDSLDIYIGSENKLVRKRVSVREYPFKDRGNQE